MVPQLPVFGLTGGIACGKSAAARHFRALGAHTIDADELGHALMAPGQPAYGAVVGRFGEEVVGSTGAIDRTKLGAKVFAAGEELAALNAILHPRIMARVEEEARAVLARQPCAVVILDAALIFEAGIARALRKVIVVWCRPEQQLERLMAKSGLSRPEAEQRIRAQMPFEEKRRRADYLIDSSGPIEQTHVQVEAIYRALAGQMA